MYDGGIEKKATYEKPDNENVTKSTSNDNTTMSQEQEKSFKKQENEPKGKEEVNIAKLLRADVRKGKVDSEKENNKTTTELKNRKGGRAEEKTQGEEKDKDEESSFTFTSSEELNLEFTRDTSESDEDLETVSSSSKRRKRYAAQPSRVEREEEIRTPKINVRQI